MIVVVSKKKVMRGLLFCLAACMCVAGTKKFILQRNIKAASAIGEQKAYIAIVIDDFGYCGDGTDEMLALEIPLTAAVMPFSSCTSEDVQRIKAAGKEMIVHMPMESLTGKKSWVGDKGVFRTMTDDEIKQCVLEALTVVDGAVGLNNHMGSAIMEDQRSLNAVMQVVAEEELVFIDSKTTPKSVAETVCTTNQVPILERDVFLDSTDDIAVVKRQLLKTGDIALQKGAALCIGHVGPEGGKITAQAIKEIAPKLKEKGIIFVTVSQLNQIMQLQTK